MIKVSIVGAAGYVGGELLRILLGHPQVTSVTAVSASQKNKKVEEVHHDLMGYGMTFSECVSDDTDVLFIARGHGRSKSYLENNPPKKNQIVIDLSSDFRIESDEHTFVYGLPEWQREKISKSNTIANCGCFATAIQLGLLPLLKQKALIDDVHIQGVTGSTGAGQELCHTSHFSWRSANASTYKVLEHQHIREVEQLKSKLQQEDDIEFLFVPMRGCFARGILISMYTKTDLSEEQLLNVYTHYYKDEPFTHVVENKDVHVKMVTNTNNCFVRVEKKKGYAVITTAIDNMIKGAAGQAVQNMNIRLAYEEAAGLQLKPSFF